MTTQTGCGAEQSTCVFVCKREVAAYLGVVGLTHTCVRVCAEGGCPSDSALHGRE